MGSAARAKGLLAAAWDDRGAAAMIVQPEVA